MKNEISLDAVQNMIEFGKFIYMNEHYVAYGEEMDEEKAHDMAAQVLMLYCAHTERPIEFSFD